MFNSIKGKISAKKLNRVFLENQGIEWALDVSANTLSKISISQEEIRLFTYLHHTENAMDLYGFVDEKERELFLKLIKVSGIGPKAAVKILSGMGPDSFIQAVESEDISSLCRIPGLGKKSAQKIILALQGKLAREEKSLQEGGQKELLDALVEMGFDRKKAASILQKIGSEIDFSGMSSTEQEQELFRQAIVQLSS